MRSKEEIVERYLQIKSLVGFKSELSASDEEMEKPAEKVMEEIRRTSWQDIHNTWKTKTAPGNQYDTGVFTGKLQILNWVLGGEEE